MRAFLRALILLAAFLGGCTGLTMINESAPQVITSKNVQTLHKREWTLKTLAVDGRQVVMDVDARITIRFEAGGQVFGFAAVNRFNGTYRLNEEGVLDWSRPGYAATRRAGPPELMEKERAFLSALGRTSAVILSRHALQLQSDDSTTVLLFHETGY